MKHILAVLLLLAFSGLALAQQDRLNRQLQAYEVKFKNLMATRGLEFGVSPMPETRRQMIERGRLFDTPAFRWIPARLRVEVEYVAVLRRAERLPDTLSALTA